MKDVNVLLESYFNYKDKEGKKAKSLKKQIESYKSFHELGIFTVELTEEEAIKDMEYIASLNWEFIY